MVVSPSAHASDWNALLARREHRARVRVMRARPRDVTIESTTHCNLRCVICPHVREAEVHKEHLPDRLAERLGSVIPRASRFQLHGLGEPLLSPAFWKLLDRIARQHRGDPDVAFNTNGLLLNDSNIARLVASKAREINISLDAASADTYARIRGADLDRVLANIGALVRARNAAGRTDLRVYVNMTLVRANIEELPEFVRLAKRLGVDQAQFWRVNEGADYDRPDWIVTKGSWRFSYIDEAPSRYPNLFNATVREATRVAEEIGMSISDEVGLVEGEGQVPDPPYPPSRGTETVPAAPRAETRGSSARARSAAVTQCDAPWRWLLVKNRGDCYPCCHARAPVGNLNAASSLEIWNNQTMQELRTAIARGEIHRLCAGASCRFVRGEG